MLWVFVFGVGTDAPIRYSTMMLSVKSNFFRRSGVRNADANALSTHPPARTVGDVDAAGWRRWARGPYVQVVQANRLVTIGRLQLGNRPAGRLNLSRADPENACALMSSCTAPRSPL